MEETSDNWQPTPLEPLTIAQILDRSFRLAPKVFDKLIIPFALLAGLETAQLLPAVAATVHAQGLMKVAVAVLNVYIALLVMILSANLWRGAQVSIQQVREQITFGFAVRFFLLGVRIVLATILGLLLLVVPGLIYSINRLLAPYIYVLERTTAKEALAKSKRLMQSAPVLFLTGRLLAILLVMSLVTAAAAAAMIAGTQIAGLSEVSRKIAALINFFAFMLSGFGDVIKYLCYTGLYFDFLARFEGADLLEQIERLDAGTEAWQGQPE